jgi:lysophospholipase L1-like esterase
VGFQRYVAIGDSSTEGMDDPDGAGGYRGWANRLAEHVARAQGGLLYANLAVRGKLTREIRGEQLGPALEMRPDLATVFAGSNDILKRRFDPAAVAEDVAAMHRSLVAGGAVVLTFTLPDLTGVMPIGRFLAPRVRALNESLRSAAASGGARLVDFAAQPVSSDRRIWSEDRFHANAVGHARIAAALARALDLPGSDDTWNLPLPAERGGRLKRWTADLGWWFRHLLPWHWIRPARAPWVAKRPRLEPVRLPD